MSIFFTLAILSSLAGFPSCFSADQQYEQCRSPLTCGSASKIFPNTTTYPFWGDSIGRPDFCGRAEFKLSCEDDNQNLTLKIDDRTLRVLSSNLSDKSIIVADESLLEGNCPKFFDFKGNYHFTNGPNTETIDLYDCLTPPSTPYSTFICNDEDTKTFHFFQPNSSTHNCFKTREIPVLKKNLHFQSNEPKQELLKALEQGFELRYTIRYQTCQNCTDSSGICGSKPGSQDFRCLCEDKPHKISCNITDKGKINWKVKTVIVVVAGFFGITGACIVCYVCYRRKLKVYRTSSALLPRNLSSEPSSKSSDVERADELLVGVQLFSYEELEEATNNFDPSKELGDGGFGTVYFGKLKDGRSVAVKRLYDNNYKRASQFRNEVEILTGLRHPNLVALFGCSSKQSRDLLLVYEYVANGTLADHLHGPQANPSTLPWSIRLKIAVETASALKYLHASEIIHRDVKSNNILLDQNFNVKVADFGLSRLFPMGQTHVSTAPQGTPGYVDPDYHLCYQLSNKSDVYSFAVVLMELISSLPAVDIARPRHEINLSSMAVIKIQNHELHAMVDPSLGFDTDTKVRQSVTAVAELAFQCLQSDKDLRPCMSHVLETLTRVQNNGFGSQMDVTDVNKSGPLQSPDSVMVKWDSK